MKFRSAEIRCEVLGGNIAIITNERGDVKRVVCPEFARLTHGCYKKNRDLDLGTLVLIRAQDLSEGRTTTGYCDFGHPKESLLERALRAIRGE